MNTHADASQTNQSKAVANNLSEKTGSGESLFQFADNRPEAVAQRKLQEMIKNSPRVAQLSALHERANNSPQVKQAARLQAMADAHSTAQRIRNASTFPFVADRPGAIVQKTLQKTGDLPAHGLIQRKPQSDTLTEDEETAIQTALDNGAYQDAINLLRGTAFFARIDPGNVGALTYDANSPYYGLAQQDATDPETNNTVNISFGLLAVQNIPILMSTFYHELIHAKQHTQRSKSAGEIGGVDYVYGYAAEKSGYIEAAQEIQTHWTEIMNAEGLGTHTNIAFLTDRGEALSNYWFTLYNAARNQGSGTKKAKYRDRVKPLVKQAYETLRDKYGVDISGFDTRGLAR